MRYDVDGAVAYLEGAFRATPEFMAMSALQDGWRGQPEFLAMAATRLGALVGQTSAGAKTLFVDMAQLDTIRAAQVRPAPPATVAAPALGTAAQPASAPATPAHTAAPVAAKKESFMSHSYTDQQIRQRVSSIFGSNASRGAERLALLLVASEMSVDSALTNLRVARGAKASPNSIDVEAIYRRRAEAESGHAREVFADNERAHYRDPTTEAGAAAIYARRAAQAKQAATGPGF